MPTLADQSARLLPRECMGLHTPRRSLLLHVQHDARHTSIRYKPTSVGQGVGIAASLTVSQGSKIGS